MFFHRTYRHKIHLLSPNQMHRFYNLSRSYQHRKVQVVALAKEMCKLLTFETSWESLRRQHDVGDALCMLWWFAHARKQSVTRSPYFAQRLCIADEGAPPMPSFSHLRHYAQQHRARTRNMEDDGVSVTNS
jgi:hypothetical protein